VRIATVASALVAVLGTSILVPLGAPSVGASPLVTVSACGSSSPSSVANGSTLDAGGCLVSPDHQYELVMQIDGNLVLYYQSQADPLWDSGTEGSSGASATLQTDGNLVVSSTAGVAWAAGSNGTSNADLVLQDDGNLVVYGTNPTGSAYAAWSTSTFNLRGYMLPSGETLEPGQYLKSQNGTWTLSMTSAGYLVQSSTISAASPYACPIWSEPAIVNYNPLGGDNVYNSQPNNPPITTYDPQNLSFSYTGNVPNSSGYPATFTPPSFVGGATNAIPTPNAYLTMQTDGNLVLYSPGAGPAQWATGTNPSSGTLAVLQNDGNFVVYAGSGQVLWSSGTNAYRGTALCTDQTLQQGQFLGFTGQQTAGQPVSGPTLVMQKDCNLVLYETSQSGTATPVWSSDTDELVGGSPPSQFGGCDLVMQNDDNLVLYAPNDDNAVLWTSNTYAGSQAGPTGNPFVGPYWLSIYNPYLVLQRWGTESAWKADPENVIPSLSTATTLSSGTAGGYVANGVNEALTNNVYSLGDVLDAMGWL
jgi:hypothetical protein